MDSFQTATATVTVSFSWGTTRNNQFPSRPTTTRDRAAPAPQRGTMSCQRIQPGCSLTRDKMVGAREITELELEAAGRVYDVLQGADFDDLV